MADTHPSRPSHTHAKSQRAGPMARAFLFFGPTRDSGSSLVRRWFRIRRMLAVGVAVFLVGICVLAFLARSQASRPPAWWAPPERTRACEAEAEQLEHALVNRTHEVRTSPGWVITLDESAVNAWLATRLEDWAAAQDPPIRTGQLGKSQAMFRTGRIYVAVQVVGGAWDGKILTAGIEPTVAADGKLVLELRSATIGRLALPAGWVSRIAPQGRTPAGVVLDRDGGRLEIASPTLKLADDRLVRLVGVRVGEGTLTLEATTAR